MKTGKMTEKLNYGEVAKCVKGEFKGLHATKNEHGHVILIEEDIAYDFWDSRFYSCEWSLTA